MEQDPKTVANQETTEPVAQTVETVEPEETPKKKKKKHHFIRNFFYILSTIIVFLLLANTALAVVNFIQISNDKEPYFFTDVVSTEENGVTKNDYKQGFYHIVEKKEGTNLRYMLKPFFLK